jgi:curli biogenesis system outer membrane secretion channel CsgG
MQSIVRVSCWILLAITTSVASAGDKPVLAVADFTNSARAGWWRSGAGSALSDMLTNELAATNAFTMVERKQLANVLREQDLSVTGRVAAGTAANIGALTGAQYLVTATVSAFEENTAGSGGGLSFGGFSVGGKKKSAYLAFDLRVIDTSSGEIVDVRTVEGYSKGGGISLGMRKWGVGGVLESEKKTPTGKAIRAAIIESSNYLECSMVKQDSCMGSYNAKEQRRSESASGVLDLD